MYKAFQDTTLTGQIHTEAKNLGLGTESVSDLGASKEQTRSDDGRYIVRYLMDFSYEPNCQLVRTSFYLFALFVLALTP